MRFEFVWDDALGTVAAAYDEDGNLVATAADHRLDDGTYIAIDEAQYWEATGELLPWIPAEKWDEAAPPPP